MKNEKDYWEYIASCNDSLSHHKKHRHDRRPDVIIGKVLAFVWAKLLSFFVHTKQELRVVRNGAERRIVERTKRMRRNVWLRESGAIAEWHPGREVHPIHIKKGAVARALLTFGAIALIVGMGAKIVTLEHQVGTVPMPDVVTSVNQALVPDMAAIEAQDVSELLPDAATTSTETENAPVVITDTTVATATTQPTVAITSITSASTTAKPTTSTTMTSSTTSKTTVATSATTTPTSSANNNNTAPVQNAKPEAVSTDESGEEGAPVQGGARPDEPAEDEEEPDPEPAPTSAVATADIKPGTVYPVSEKITGFIASYEGRKANEPYKCEASCWTIGYGHAYTSAESKKWSKETALKHFNEDIKNALGEEHMISKDHPRLSDKEAKDLLRWDLEKGPYKRNLDQFIQKNGLILEQRHYDAMLSFAYNCGENVWTRKTFSFRAYLLGLPNRDLRKANDKRIIKLLGAWSHAGGRVQPGLARRRANEAMMFNSGSYRIINMKETRKMRASVGLSTP